MTAAMLMRRAQTIRRLEEMDVASGSGKRFVYLPARALGPEPLEEARAAGMRHPQALGQQQLQLVAERSNRDSLNIWPVQTRPQALNRRPVQLSLHL